MEQTLKTTPGALAQSLLRNASKIKEDRALAILRVAERYYKRRIEDLKDKIVDLEAVRENRLDMSPDDINTLKVASNFDAEKFFVEDEKDTLIIRETRIRLEELESRYNYLFGAVRTELAVTA